ncbi:MAG: glycerol-3-phosphate dehydrogenase [Alphaproteobacteria bacterium]|nr:glycerol-3-phosphate dehydrogenase [Alphaproteobacteria bacterium]
MTYDLAIIGGGINGAGIARDAAGRGLKVLLLEKGDLAGATSSASSKLVHGGLRYLEYREFRLVREALQEREVLLGIAPHIIWPMDFLLPLGEHTRSGWLIGLGLFLYDHLAWGMKLRKSSKITLRGEVLKDEFFHGYRYTDCWVDDARLVLANLQDAAARGADIRLRTACTALTQEDDGWQVTLETGETLRAKAIVNAAGPWVENISRMAGVKTKGKAKLIKGSHIVVPKIHNGKHAYILQLPDKRILFILPFQDEFSLIGTTDIPFSGDAKDVAITDAEVDYLLDAVNGYLMNPLSQKDIVWSYAGVRSLYDDGSSNASAITRDYVLEIDEKTQKNAPFLTIFGGKITTFRRLSEAVIDKLHPQLSAQKWTHAATLPGGERFDAPTDGIPARWLRQYGAKLLEIGEKGEEIAAGLCEAELRYSRDHEWARTAEDFLWRRTKLGLTLNAEEQQRIAAWFDKNAK